jgi:hypothetical protein
VPTIEVQSYLGPNLAITVPTAVIFYKILKSKLIWAKINQNIPTKAMN